MLPSLGSAASGTAEALLARLRGLGLSGIERLRLTRNRATMVSFRGPSLRVHAAFADAPSDVLRAIVVFVNGRGRARRDAQRAILAYDVPRELCGPRRREQTHPDDAGMNSRLTEAHDRLNLERFDGALRRVPVRVSRRMKTRLGHYAPGSDGAPAEIVISRRHIRRHGWTDAFDTLLHEMVHQWQDETGRPLGHGPDFRAKARAVGAPASARRAPGSPEIGARA